MLIVLSENEISLQDYDEKASYNVKDLRISVPSEVSSSDEIFALLNTEKYELNLLEEKGDDGAGIYSLKLKEEAFKGGVVTFILCYGEQKSNAIEINLNPYTSFSVIYNLFFDKITDDMYMELTKEETYQMVHALFISALPYFEFPRVNIYDFDKKLNIYNIALSLEEMDIIATYMAMYWISQQLASVENTRMKYSGSDFKFTSQANHMAKLQNLKKEFERMGFHLQRLYKRRKADEKGIMRSTFGSIMESSLKKG